MLSNQHKTSNFWKKLKKKVRVTEFTFAIPWVSLSINLMKVFTFIRLKWKEFIQHRLNRLKILSYESKIRWADNCQYQFQRLRRISTAIVLIKLFDFSTILQVDWSKQLCTSLECNDLKLSMKSRIFHPAQSNWIQFPIDLLIVILNSSSLRFL